ncbi:molybdopterin cofactor-binding domain-containing protein [Nonomuraea ferruginea]
MAGPRVTKVVFAVDVGLAVNPRGLEAQMMGCVMDGIALALTSSLHLRDGHFLEASWDNYFYTRQWNTPPELQVIVMPSTSDQPGGRGGAGRRRVDGRGRLRVRTRHRHDAHQLPDQPRDALVHPQAHRPPIPPSPTDGLDHAR